jgi:hypothetical protein
MCYLFPQPIILYSRLLLSYLIEILTYLIGNNYKFFEEKPLALNFHVDREKQYVFTIDWFNSHVELNV